MWEILPQIDGQPMKRVGVEVEAFPFWWTLQGCPCIRQTRYPQEARNAHCGSEIDMHTKKRKQRSSWTLGHAGAGYILGAMVAMVGVSGCKSNQPTTPAPVIDDNGGQDPAAANLAPVDPNAPVQSAPAYAPAPASKKVRVLGQQSSYAGQQTAESYPQQVAPQQGYAQPPAYAGGYSDQQAYDGNYDADSSYDAGYSALQAPQPPPPLPEYDQPPRTGTQRSLDTRILGLREYRLLLGSWGMGRRSV